MSGLIKVTHKGYYQGADGQQQSGDENYGSYQFTPFTDFVSQFMISYIGEDKIISKAKRYEVAFHAKRGLQEFSFDILKSIKAQEIQLPSNLQMVLPHDYVNYTKLVWSDSNGIEHIIYPTSKTSNPTIIDQATDGTYNIDTNDYDSDGSTTDLQRAANARTTESTTSAGTTTSLTLAAPNSNIKVGMMVTGHANILQGTYVKTYAGGTTVVLSSAAQGAFTATLTYTSLTNTSNTSTNYKSSTPSELKKEDYEDDVFWPLSGERYGLDPQHSHANGSYYIDEVAGIIHFSSNLAGKTIILKYISDSLGTEEEIRVPKLAEEALYKWVAYALISTRANTDQNIVARIKKERFAEMRKAKLRLSNIKLEEITQVLRGKSKQIKH